MFMSSSDGPRPSRCCPPPLCLFSAWERLHNYSYWITIEIGKFLCFPNWDRFYLVEMPGDGIPWKVPLFCPTPSFLCPWHFLHFWWSCWPWWFFLLLPSSRRKLVKEYSSRVRSLPPWGSTPAQQDDGCHEGEEGEACHTGKADNEPDGDAGTGF